MLQLGPAETFRNPALVDSVPGDDPGDDNRQAPRWHQVQWQQWTNSGSLVRRYVTWPQVHFPSWVVIGASGPSLARTARDEFSGATPNIDSALNDSEPVVGLEPNNV